VHIKTEGVYNKEEDHPSDCHLWVLHGTQEPDSNTSSLPLTVPKKAASLVGMGFLPTEHRCSLSVLFESAEEEDRSASMQLTYPPSIMSIVSPEPVDTGHASLDKVAAQERARIRSLLFGPSVLEDSDPDQSSLEEVLHELDSLYMKFIFRPMFPRGTGTVLPPSESCIRRALAKMVHGAKKQPGVSVELETVRTMYEWRHRENRKLVALTPLRNERQRSTETSGPETAIVAVTSPYSVYETFVQGETDDEMQNEMDADGDNEEDMERLDQERSTEMEAHENRWRRFLLQVWEEEQIIRLPLRVAWLDTVPIQIIVRAGITTVAEGKPRNFVEEVAGPWLVLDGTAMKLLQCIEQDKDKSARLYAVEQHMTTLVSKAQLAVAPLNQSQSFVLELTALGRWAWSEDEVDGISDAEHEQLEEAVSTLSPMQLVNWIQGTPKDHSGSLPGIELVDSDEVMPTGGRITWSQKQVANCQLRHAACSLSVRCIDSVRRLQLSRCLLLLDLVEGSHAREAALRAYLHTIAVLWTSAQRVPMPSTALQTKKRDTLRLGERSPDSFSPPNKRLSFGDDASSILAPLNSTMTTTMDVMVIGISQTMDESSSVSSSPIGAAVLLSRSYFRLTFSARGDIPIGKPSLLPELGSLPRPGDDSIATDYPRLALRLLSPYVACSLPEDSGDVVVARKESLAECLLIESHSESSNTALKSQMRQMACELLVPKGSHHDNSVDQRMIRTAFEALESLRRKMPAGTSVSKEALTNSVQQMIQTGTSIEFRRLCELETVKTLFTPLAAGVATDMDGITRASINLVASIMLHLSRVMYRLTILERHVRVCATDDDGENPDILLGFISGAINEMGKTFPDDVCHVMPEYGKMWSRLFHHAVLAGHWRQAYSACVRNPKSELRESSFRRLVRSMVDSGALNDLLEMCTELGMRVSSSSSLSPAEAGECVDLYEIASEILAEAISRDVYTVRAASTEPAGLSDFQGALYALHASQKQWRRAAQSMDLRYLNATAALRARDFSFNLPSAELRDGLIVEDLVLAAVGAVNSIELVKDNAHRFLVSGEYGPYNTIPIEGLDEARNPVSRMKRTRGTPDREGEDVPEEREDRLSNFMTIVALEGRAIRGIALRTLFFDRSSDPSFAKSAFLREFESSKLDIDELFKHGYYRYGLLLAKSWSKNCEELTGSSQPEGEDLFYTCLSHLLDTCLMQLTLEPRPEDASAFSRPSLHQLHVALDEVGSAEGASSYIVTERSNRVADLQGVAVNTAAMALIRKLTLAYSTAETPVALDVAFSFLEQGEHAQVPAWLERLLMGADVSSSSQSSGLFSRRPKPGSCVYLGDPSALVSLYTKRGMFVEACNIVTATLSGVEGYEGGSRESRAASRLPEEGEIDFVPYQTIDLLWNLIELVLSKRVIGRSEKKSISGARGKMKAALEKHFALMKISEVGMRSARALKQG
jgi:hypothetical protein